MNDNTPERFREVEPLPIADGFKAATISNGRALIVHMLVWDIAEARANALALTHTPESP